MKMRCESHPPCNSLYLKEKSDKNRLTRFVKTIGMANKKQYSRYEGDAIEGSCFLYKSE